MIYPPLSMDGGRDASEADFVLGWIDSGSFSRTDKDADGPEVVCDGCDKWMHSKSHRLLRLLESFEPKADRAFSLLRTRSVLVRPSSLSLPFSRFRGKSLPISDYGFAEKSRRSQGERVQGSSRALVLC